jgi:hypothetical protein
MLSSFLTLNQSVLCYAGLNFIFKLFICLVLALVPIEIFYKGKVGFEWRKIWRLECFVSRIFFSVTTLAFTAPGTRSHAVYIKYLKLGFLKVPKAVTTTQVVVTAGVVSEVSPSHLPPQQAAS